MTDALRLGSAPRYIVTRPEGNEHHTMAEVYDLIAAARAKFGELSAAEEKMLRCAESGDVAYCGPSAKDDDPENDPAKASEWGKDRTIRAKLIQVAMHRS